MTRKRESTGPDRADARLAERERMVEEQIARRGVLEARVLEAMRRIPRHRFVPPEQEPFAYEDRPLPVGHGQTISQPYIVALMTDALAVGPRHRVLEVGTGTGYQTAILALLAGSVWTIEIVEALSRRARRSLAELGLDNVHARTGDGWAGWPEAAPFDRIIVTAAPDRLPEALVAQLADGGRMVVPVGDARQELLLVTRRGDRVHTRGIAPVRFVPMVHATAASAAAGGDAAPCEGASRAEATGARPSSDPERGAGAVGDDASPDETPNGAAPSRDQPGDPGRSGSTAGE